VPRELRENATAMAVMGYALAAMLILYRVTTQTTWGRRPPPRPGRAQLYRPCSTQSSGASLREDGRGRHVPTWPADSL